jgi:AraC family transcriptional regulator
MGLPSALRVAGSRWDAHAATQVASRAAHSVRVSSRNLGWAALNYERRDYQPSSRALAAGSSEHLVFVSLTAGRIVRGSGGEPVEHALSPGCVAVVPARTPVSWSWSTRVSFSVLHLDPGFLDRVAQSVFGLEPHQYCLTLAERRHDTAITNIAGVLAREVIRGERGSGLYAQSLASILAVHLLREYAQCAGGRALRSCATLSLAGAGASLEAGHAGALQPRAVSDALAFIHANYARELPLTDLAQAARLSPFHLARLFKRSLGVSPHQYLIQVRVNNARWLLSAASGECSLADLAAAVGFADQSHLTRHFKRMTGVTPRQYRPRYETS